MNPDIHNIFRQGQFAAAAEALRGLSLVSGELAVLNVEVSYFVGDADDAADEAHRILRNSQTPLLRSRLLAVLASIKWDNGELAGSIALTREAHHLAVATGDAAAIARSAVPLLERTCNSSTYDASLPLSSLARRSAFRCGDVQVLSLLHLTHGRLEARSGTLDLARRHFDRCHSLLARDPNVWLLSATFLDQAHAFSLEGDTAGAIKAAKTGCDLAQDAGWSKGVAAAAANLAALFLSVGDLSSARACVQRASREKYSGPAFTCALLETEARIEARCGNLNKAEELLERAVSPNAAVPLWYRVKASESLARLYARAKRYTEMMAIVESCLTTLRTVRLPALERSFLALRLEALEALGHSVGVDDLPINAPTDASGAQVSYETLARLLRPMNQGRAMAFDGRSRRVAGPGAEFEVLGVVPDGIVNVTADGTTLDAAVALLELAGHPHILGAEAVALLRGSNCAARLALVAAGRSGVRVVDAVGWEPAQAIAAAAAATDTIEHLPLGKRTEEIWTLVVEPVRELEPYCTFAAIRKLLAIALSLDGYRRDEKQRAALWPADALDGDNECIWASEQMSEVLTTARRIAAAVTPLPVLITGETGTGKEMVARTIHRASDRADRPFLPFNCAAVPREMLESQLFGYRKGAFTSADSGFQGVIRSAAGGTLFLDEIGEIGPEMQPKLLRFLETHEIHPLGEPQPIKVDVRVIAATNASVERLVADGKFRDDLFYRLNVMRLALPPLRERREEIPPLVQHYVRKYSEEQRKGNLTVSDETLEYLLLFPWPGNVRQLSNEIRRMVALAEPDSTLTPAQLSSELQASRRTIAAPPALDLEARVPLDQPLPVAVEMLEQMMVRRALDRTHGRVEEASRLLGISRKGLFLKRRRWGFGQVS